VFSLALLVIGMPAQAAPMDPAIERLVTNASSCRTQGGEIAPIAPGTGASYVPCQPDNAAFTRLINQYGFAFAPTAMHSARTTGFGGIHISLEAAYTKIDSSRDYWRRGTQGEGDPVTGQPNYENSSPVGMLQLYSVKLRKSFGFGFEITGSAGTMPKTSLWSTGADVRLSLLEGFRKSIPGFIPDLAVGGGVRTISGTPELQLTISSLDVQISKPIPIAHAVTLTPWLGYQYLWIFGDSNVVDFTPATDPFAYCGYAGTYSPPYQQDPRGQYSGQPICNNTAGGVWDFNNNRTFDPVRLHRQRLLIGSSVRYETFMFGVQFITDLVKPASTQGSQVAKDALQGENRQWTGVLEIGAMF
jgi:hypothetical protein